MARVSAVIPTYNRATLLPEAIDGVLRQAWKDIEILVVDDGSTDGTPAVARVYSNRIKYLRQPNRGVNAARNAAVAVATGDFIALLDSDDIWLPHAVSLLASLLTRFPTAGFAYGDFLILRDGETLNQPGLRGWHDAEHPLEAQFDLRYRSTDLGFSTGRGPHERDFDVFVGDIYHSSLFGPRVPTSGSLIRRSLMRDMRFPEHDSLCGDWEFFARLSHRHGAVYADIPVMLNRSHNDEVRLTRADGALQLEKRIELVDRVWAQDQEFLARHGADVDARRFALLLDLARNRMLAGDGTRARTALSRAAPFRGSRRLLEWLGLRAISRTPGAPSVLRFLRLLRRTVRRPTGGHRR